MRRYALFLLVLLLGGAAAAQEERAIDNFAGVGVRAMGMGGAFAGVADDFAALYWNPAGLAQMRQRQVRVGFVRNSRDGESTFNGAAGASQLSNTRFGSMGFVYPYPVYRGSLVLAIGFHRLKDFDWNINQRGIGGGDSLRADHLFQHEGEQSLFAAAAAVDVSPAISLGLTLGLTSGRDQASNEFVWTDPADRYLERRFLATDTFDDEYGRSWYATLGAMVRTPRARPRLRLGATLTTTSAQEVRYTFRGVLGEQGYQRVDYDDGTTVEIEGEVVRGRYEIALPLEFGLGASYAPLPGLLLAASAHFAEWSQSEYEKLDADAFRADNAFERQYRDVVRYHLGAEWQVPAIALDLRAGFYTDPLPFVGPRDPDPFGGDPPIRIVADRRFLTLGASLLVDEVVQVDLAWVRGRYEQVEETIDSGAVNRLREESRITRVFIGVGYVF